MWTVCYMSPRRGVSHRQRLWIALRRLHSGASHLSGCTFRRPESPISHAYMYCKQTAIVRSLHVLFSIFITCSLYTKNLIIFPFKVLDLGWYTGRNAWRVFLVVIQLEPKLECATNSSETSPISILKRINIVVPELWLLFKCTDRHDAHQRRGYGACHSEHTENYARQHTHILWNQHLSPGEKLFVLLRRLQENETVFVSYSPNYCRERSVRRMAGSVTKLTWIICNSFQKNRISCTWNVVDPNCTVLCSSYLRRRGDCDRLAYIWLDKFPLKIDICNHVNDKSLRRICKEM